MKKNLVLSLSMLLFAFGFWSCQPDDSNHVPNDVRITDFVWKGMNLYYLWQQEVPDLDDNRFANQSELNAWLAQNNEPVALFNHLRVDTSIDRFSVIYSDYRILEGVLSGTTGNNGVDFALRYKTGSTTDIFGWVRYILPNSDASTKDIHRGDIFYAVNGTPLTSDNYQQLLSQQTYTLNLADYDNGNITPNGESVALTKSVYSENPVYQREVFNIGNHKIGYLMYNGFYPNYDNALNQAFGQLKSQNITDLVLDLRYNSGGSIQTATYLASMITGQFNGQVFAKEQWNDKLMDYWSDQNADALVNRFTDEINNASANSLELNTVYILTSKSTASASELVISCLKPYVNVVQVGDVTTGKNVGSVTLYDSPSFQKKGADRSHYYAMQPIVLKVVDKNGFGDYASGLEPNYDYIEDLGNLGVIGTTDEPLLSTAIGIITGNGRMIRQSPTKTFTPFKDSKSLDGLRDQMYTSRIPR
ncbi:S41 family peptidase [Flavobacterium selenitireducens]|uniref:S41 family peptidase n=1 Tax=Flavobacterium selenitireducens TaxID=2722704 RepID=UPI00168A51DF|nr:S41 family peptidase [Flavobacterium selenitireducens]MBD3582831.1 peptidase S41 [Flavobacterium selenitireducens]